MAGGRSAAVPRRRRAGSRFPRRQRLRSVSIIWRFCALQIPRHVYPAVAPGIHRQHAANAITGLNVDCPYRMRAPCPTILYSGEGGTDISRRSYDGIMNRQRDSQARQTFCLPAAACSSATLIGVQRNAAMKSGSVYPAIKCIEHNADQYRYRQRHPSQ